MSKIVEVAAAVFLRQGPNGTEYLLAQRPVDKVYAGYWEFPGGKVEPGETLREALIREIEEEMGATVERAWPWLSRQFTYPHATVRLKFFQVESWRGELRPLEHSGIIWVRLGDDPPVEPVLPANGPILRALALPHHCCILDVSKPLADQLSRTPVDLSEQRRLIRISRLSATPAVQTAQLDALRDFIARNANVEMLVDDDLAAARAISAHGIHLSQATLRRTDVRPDLAWVSASCRDALDLDHAIALGVDFVAFPAPSPGIGMNVGDSRKWDDFATLIERAPIPVFIENAPETLSLAAVHRYGVHGLMSSPV